MTNAIKPQLLLGVLVTMIFISMTSGVQAQSIKVKQFPLTFDEAGPDAASSAANISSLGLTRRDIISAEVYVLFELDAPGGWPMLADKVASGCGITFADQFGATTLNLESAFIECKDPGDYLEYRNNTKGTLTLMYLD